MNPEHENRVLKDLIGAFLVYLQHTGHQALADHLRGEIRQEGIDLAP